jgi:hypothetical protein
LEYFCGLISVKPAAGRLQYQPIHSSRGFAMSSIPSITHSAHCPAKLGSYEINAKAYGPVVATAIGAGEALGQWAESTYTAGSQTLNELAATGTAAYEAVAQATQSAVQGVEDGFQAVGQFISDTAGAVGDAVHEAVDAVGEAVDSVGDAASDVADAIGSAVGDAAVYATLGAVGAQGLDAQS